MILFYLKHIQAQTRVHVEANSAVISIGWWTEIDRHREWIFSCVLKWRRRKKLQKVNSAQTKNQTLTQLRSTNEIENGFFFFFFCLFDFIPCSYEFTWLFLVFGTSITEVWWMCLLFMYDFSISFYVFFSASSSKRMILLFVRVNRKIH